MFISTSAFKAYSSEHFNCSDVNMRMSMIACRALFLGTIMAVDPAPQPACESHVSASHVVSSAPVRWLVESSARSLVDFYVRSAGQLQRHTRVSCGQWLWTAELMQTQNNNKFASNTASLLVQQLNMQEWFSICLDVDRAI